MRPLWMIATALLAATVTGCRQDMHDGRKIEPLEKSAFFADGRGARPLVEGTVARGGLREDSHFYEGRVEGSYATTLPFEVDRAVLERGRERFGIFCTPCHSHLGDGNGIVVQRGFKRPPSYHQERLRAAPVGYFFDVITNGFGTMYSYESRIPPRDRWCIAAYVRALQLSQWAELSAVPEAERARLEELR